MADEVGTESQAQESAPHEDFSPASHPPLPPPTFDFLVYSLRLQAEMSLGVLPFSPAGEDNLPEPDFDMARHHIDLLAMLQDKTKGNLSMEEQRALDNSVTELRFRFVQARQNRAKGNQENQPTS